MFQLQEFIFSIFNNNHQLTNKLNYLSKFEMVIEIDSIELFYHSLKSSSLLKKCLETFRIWRRLMVRLQNC